METIRGQLEPLLVGRSVVEAWSHPSEKFTPAVEAQGETFQSVRRRGKYLIFGLGETELIIHLGMTGRLTVTEELSSQMSSLSAAPALSTSASATQALPSSSAAQMSSLSKKASSRSVLAPPAEHSWAAGATDAHLRAWWQLDDGGVFTFHDVRRFGRVYLVSSGCYESISTLHHLGPEPFDDAFNAESLCQALAKSSRHLKTQLLSQKPVAGVGNIYADEALWLAEINPVVRRLSLPRCGELVDALREVLSEGLRNGGTTLRDYVAATGEQGRNQFTLRCYGQWGRPCSRCGSTLRRRVIDARSTTSCPKCQAR